MPSRASNAALMVDSRAAADIVFPWEERGWKRLFRNLRQESQGDQPVVPAKAGTHTAESIDWQGRLGCVAKTQHGVYGPLLSQGRREAMASPTSAKTPSS